MRIAINGLGRIGRIFLRQALEVEDFEIVAINDLADKENLLYLLENDSVYRGYNLDKNKADKIKFLNEKDPAKLPWGDLEIDIVVEATGIFNSYEKAKPHLDAGAKRVVITAPVKDDNGVKTFTPNINTEVCENSKITSNGSCTTNAITPIIKILQDEIGVKKAILNTTHSYTSTQGVVDGPNKKDFRKGRAAAMNIVPSTTGSAIATGKIIPEIDGKFDGIALRIPTIVVSLLDITFIANKETSVEEINQIFRNASEKEEWSGIIKVTDKQLVSSDVIGDPYGSIIDPDFTRVVDGDLVKILSWYDNEWGYCAMLIKHIQTLKDFI